MSIRRRGQHYNFIFEQTSMVSNKDIRILEESKTKSGHPKLAFQAMLQEQNVRNKNKRIYDQTVCENIVNILGPKANSRSMLMEIDHPMFFSGSNDPTTMKRRAAITEINNCGAVCRKLSIKNGQIIGEIETLSGFKGPDLANLIVKDKIDIGFSLRALGGVEPLQDGTLKVSPTIMPITYDVVSNPSFENARVMEFLPESDMSIFSEATTIVCEGEEFNLLESENVNISDSNYIVRKFMDDIIADHFIEVVSKGMIFKF